MLTAYDSLSLGQKEKQQREQRISFHKIEANKIFLGPNGKRERGERGKLRNDTLLFNGMFASATQGAAD